MCTVIFNLYEINLGFFLKKINYILSVIFINTACVYLWALVQINVLIYLSKACRILFPTNFYVICATGIMMRGRGMQQIPYVSCMSVRLRGQCTCFGVDCFYSTYIMQKQLTNKKNAENKKIYLGKNRIFKQKMRL